MITPLLLLGVLAFILFIVFIGLMCNLYGDGN